MDDHSNMIEANDGHHLTIGAEHGEARPPNPMIDRARSYIANRYGQDVADYIDRIVRPHQPFLTSTAEHDDPNEKNRTDSTIDG